jgi:hypothetical protein
MCSGWVKKNSGHGNLAGYFYQNTGIARIREMHAGKPTPYILAGTRSLNLYALMCNYYYRSEGYA